MKKKLILLAAALLTLGITQTVFATPDAPRVVINKTTLQCDSTFYWRDECGEATLPNGWEYIKETACPENYSPYNLQVEWSKYQNSYCCQERGEAYCQAETAQPGALQTLPITTRAVEQQATPAPQNNVGDVVGGISIIAAVGLGALGVLASRNKRG